MFDDLPLGNPLSRLLKKEPCDFTRADILRIITERQIELLTFHHTGIDGQLKELKLPVGDLEQAERFLVSGERVDGSSLFKGVVDETLSDLYIVPSYKTAFINPFNARSLDFFCRYLDRDGNLAPFSPDNILAIAHERFKKTTGLELHALGELEFFLIRECDSEYFTPQRQAGYHTSAPFFKRGDIVDEMVRHIMQITGAVKYAHAEVGFIDSICSDRKMLSGRRAEQYEIEFLTRPIEEMGDFLAIAKWVIRNVAFRHGMLATFTPKLDEGVAGNGLHIHMKLVRDGSNVMTGDDGSLSDEALKLIGGLVHYASSLSAFGNTIASAFLRLVPEQEAPTRICWSDMNRSSLIRVPLGWSNISDLSRVVNPNESSTHDNEHGLQTVEIRSADGSALLYLLLAGITTAAEYGLTAEGMMELSAKTRVARDFFADKKLLEQLEPLPASCVACSRLLDERRGMYQEFGVFPATIIDYVVQMLALEDDEHLTHDLSQKSPEERITATQKIMHKDINRH